MTSEDDELKKGMEKISNEISEKVVRGLVDRGKSSFKLSLGESGFEFESESFSRTPEQLQKLFFDTMKKINPQSKKKKINFTHFD